MWPNEFSESYHRHFSPCARMHGPPTPSLSRTLHGRGNAVDARKNGLTQRLSIVLGRCLAPAPKQFGLNQIKYVRVGIA